MSVWRAGGRPRHVGMEGGWEATPCRYGGRVGGQAMSAWRARGRPRHVGMEGGWEATPCRVGMEGGWEATPCRYEGRWEATPCRYGGPVGGHAMSVWRAGGRPRHVGMEGG